MAEVKVMARPWNKGGWMNFHVIRPKETERFVLGHPDMKAQPTVRKLLKELRRLFPSQEFRIEAKGRKTSTAPRWIEFR